MRPGPAMRGGAGRCGVSDPISMTPIHAEQSISLKRHRGRFVYMMQAGSDGPIKIGVADSPAKRRTQLQHAHYETIKIIRLFRGSRKDELRLHAMFQHLLIRGEWFRNDPALFSDVGLVELDPAHKHVPPPGLADVPPGFDKNIWRQAVRHHQRDGELGRTPRDIYERLVGDARGVGV